MRIFAITAYIFGAMLIDVATTTAETSPPVLLLEPATARGHIPQQQFVRRSRSTGINSAALAECLAGKQNRITLNLFDDASFVAEVQEIETRTANSFTITGLLTGEHAGWFVIAVEDDAMVGHIWTLPNGSYQIRPHIENGDHVVQQIDIAQLGDCECGPQHQIQLPHRAPQRRAPDQGGPTDGITVPACNQLIDVMVLYTPAARNALGSDHIVRAFAYANVASSNVSFQNSGVEARMRLVHVALTNYTESTSNLGIDVGRLQSNGDGFMDEAHTLRAQYGADLVSLMVNSGVNSCGVAYVMTNPTPSFSAFSFSVVQQSCALSNLTFAHELAHNIGCNHDWSDPSSGVFPFSRGHLFTGDSGTQWRTVMATGSNTRIPYFSNPLVEFDGEPTGVPEGQPQPADNARSINLVASVVSGFVALPMIDCNNNGIDDGCDIMDGTSEDLNENGIPDECDAMPCPSDELIKLTAFDAESFDRFGGSVGMSDDRVVIGSIFDDDAGTVSGSAYVFRKDKQSAWHHETKLTASDAMPFHHFGRAVAISAGGTYIVVGAYRDGFVLSDVGAIYVFLWNDLEWVQQVKFENPDPEQGDWFGWSVAFAGHEDDELFIVVAAPFDDAGANNAGAMYVHGRTETGWDAGTKLIASDPQAGARLGYAVSGSVDGHRVIAGAPFANTGQVQSGAAYVWRREKDLWIQQPRLLANEALLDARLGWSVAIDDQRALVGAINHPENGTRSGAAFVFDADSGSQIAKLHAADAGPHKQFGASVALRGNHAVIGSALDVVANSASGSAFIFNQSKSDDWVQQAKISPRDGASFDNFGVAVAMAPTADLAIAGAHFDDHQDTVDGGSASLFSLTIFRRDCNGNGIDDQCDIAQGTSVDINNNGIPDECESPPCPADVSGSDGVVNANDLLLVINHWGACLAPCPDVPCAADVNGDCSVDVLDLQVVIEQWGPCP